MVFVPHHLAYFTKEKNKKEFVDTSNSVVIVGVGGVGRGGRG